MENPQEKKIIPIPQKWRKQYGHRRMLVPRPLDLDSFIRKIPSGKLITFPQLRNRFAFTLGADSCCPFTSGNFLRISAEAAEEDLVMGGAS
ncbi:MAG: hypothetical protein NUV68_01460 [Caldiserica bacterium]|jgi:hypothetical protein|nr:hypothetical protein [Caldisericota bacterium]MDH7562025.1 hypothetical protein [Caldisericota bacterium]